MTLSLLFAERRRSTEERLSVLRLKWRRLIPLSPSIIFTSFISSSMVHTQVKVMPRTAGRSAEDWRTAWLITAWSRRSRKTNSWTMEGWSRWIKGGCLIMESVCPCVLVQRHEDRSHTYAEKRWQELWCSCIKHYSFTFEGTERLAFYRSWCDFKPFLIEWWYKSSIYLFFLLYLLFYIHKVKWEGTKILMYILKIKIFLLTVSKG